MPGFLPDTSCMVAALCGWHEHHVRAAAEINRRLDTKETMIVAAPAPDQVEGRRTEDSGLSAARQVLTKRIIASG